MNMSASFQMLMLLFSLCAITGCGDGDPYARVPLSGTVTLDGSPVNAGSMVAYPDGKSGDGNTTDRPTVRTNIENGKFSFPSGSGPAAGAYVFEVGVVGGESAAEDSGESTPEDANETGAESASYQTLATVPDGGGDSFTVELNSQGVVTDDGEAMPPSGEI